MSPKTNVHLNWSIYHWWMADCDSRNVLWVGSVLRHVYMGVCLKTVNQLRAVNLSAGREPRLLPGTSHQVPDCHCGGVGCWASTQTSYAEGPPPHPHLRLQQASRCLSDSISAAHVYSAYSTQMNRDCLSSTASWRRSLAANGPSRPECIAINNETWSQKL